ncbi:MAG: alpha/beta hydrolase, partial [Nocardioides sp.]|uniref:alpha/beta hydrolase n=1 Tax=Nocardioides sp. TaxID=35761 RepID=UPI003F0478C7
PAAPASGADKLAPTFFTRLRLTRVLTQAMSGGALRDIDRWDIGHSWFDPGASADTTDQVLFPTSIQRTALAGPDPVSFRKTRVVLLGASMGGTFVLAAAPEIEPDAVIALSPPEEHDGVDALGPIATIDAPVLLAAGAGDTTYRDAVKALAARAPTGTETVIEPGIEPGIDHGVKLLEHRGKVRRAVDRMLAGVG